MVAHMELEHGGLVIVEQGSERAGAGEFGVQVFYGEGAILVGPDLAIINLLEGAEIKLGGFEIKGHAPVTSPGAVGGEEFAGDGRRGGGAGGMRALEG
jgi:hypothetical protein